MPSRIGTSSSSSRRTTRKSLRERSGADVIAIYFA
jgi:hypothetical protein